MAVRCIGAMPPVNLPSQVDFRSKPAKSPRQGEGFQELQIIAMLVIDRWSR